jgi:hypothetical protein
MESYYCYFSVSVPRACLALSCTFSSPPAQRQRQFLIHLHLTPNILQQLLQLALIRVLSRPLNT